MSGCLEIFSFGCYKEFLKQCIKKNSGARGYHGQLADAAKCPRSYLSRIVNLDAHLSQEQAIRLTAFWSFSELETEYFLELINLGRTNFPPLTNRIKKRLQLIKRESANISKRYSELESLEREKEVHYYSTWHPIAIHVLLGIPEFKSPKKISGHLGISLQLVNETLEKLKGMGLAKRAGDSWTRAPGHIHLSNSSPLISQHHQNWRQKAVEHSRDSHRESLHYTVVQSHGFSDYAEIKQILLSAMDKVRKVVVEAPNEEISCLNIDFFRPF